LCPVDGLLYQGNPFSIQIFLLLFSILKRAKDEYRAAAIVAASGVYNCSSYPYKCPTVMFEFPPSFLLAVANLIFAGAETSAIAIRTTLLYVSRNSHIFNTLL
jgi:hypothetical protein